MSSGFGTNGGRGRCFPFFQDFAKCYSQANHPDDCQLQFEDYQECLYHKKEKTRAYIIANKDKIIAKEKAQKLADNSKSIET